jgi:hypothetical protein
MAFRVPDGLTLSNHDRRWIMSPTYRNLLHWTPRVLGVAYAAFISLFAMDVWGMGGDFWDQLAGFLIHLMPTYIIIAALIVAWRRPRLGGVLFLLLATAFALFFGWREVVTLLVMALPPTVVGLLFVADGCLGEGQLKPRM